MDEKGTEAEVAGDYRRVWLSVVSHEGLGNARMNVLVQIHDSQ